MSMASNTKSAKRIAVVGGLFGLMFGLIALRAVDLQVLNRSFLSSKAKNQYCRQVASSPQRGVIYDARYRELGVSLDVTSVAARPPEIADKKTASRALASNLDMKPQEVMERLESGRPFVWIKRHANPRQADIVREKNLPGIEFSRESSRFYPNRALAAQVIGFCGVDGLGLEGLEFSFNSVLAGKETQWTVWKDALGRSFSKERKSYSKKNGDNLVLTIDRTVQYIAESALAEAVDKYGAVSGIAIVMAPQTGAVLAMANVPQFNPNDFGKHQPADWRNRAVTDTFEPGSTLKVFMAAAAIDSGICDSGSIFYCENGKYHIGRNAVNDTHPHGWLSLQQIVKFSSNIGSVKVGEKIGPKVLYQTLQRFGFGEKLGIECPGEVSGSLDPYETWSAMDAGAIAFGQGVSVTALQMASAVSALANGGVLMRPRLVQAVTDSRDRLVRSFPAEPLGQAVSEQTAEIVGKIMKTVVQEGGTGVQAALDGYYAAGKTGTAQKADENGGYAKGRYVASFVGFAPFARPELAIVVLVDEPSKEYYGGVVAAPVFRRIAQETLQYMNVPPEFDSKQLTASLAKGGPA